MSQASAGRASLCRAQPQPGRAQPPHELAARGGHGAAGHHLVVVLLLAILLPLFLIVFTIL